MNAQPSDQDPSGRAGLARYNGLDRRLTVLETRFDTILPTLATKRDIEDLRREFGIGLEALRAELQTLRADIFKALHDTLKWMIGIVITMFIGLLGANFAMFNAVKTLIESSHAVGPAVDRHRSADPNFAPAVPKGDGLRQVLQIRGMSLPVSLLLQRRSSHRYSGADRD